MSPTLEGSSGSRAVVRDPLLRRAKPPKTANSTLNQNSSPPAGITATSPERSQGPLCERWSAGKPHGGLLPRGLLCAARVVAGKWMPPSRVRAYWSQKLERGGVKRNSVIPREDSQAVVVPSRACAYWSERTAQAVVCPFARAPARTGPETHAAPTGFPLTPLVNGLPPTLRLAGRAAIAVGGLVLAAVGTWVDLLFGCIVGLLSLPTPSFPSFLLSERAYIFLGRSEKKNARGGRERRKEG
jgi:hypothetical protein